MRLLIGTALACLILTACGNTPSKEPGQVKGASGADSASIERVNCCVKPSCDVCVEKFGRCNCLEDLKAGRPICGECIEGYKHGRGKLKLITIPELKKREGT